jgi:hypothetical protein
MKPKFNGVQKSDAEKGNIMRDLGFTAVNIKTDVFYIVVNE